MTVVASSQNCLYVRCRAYLHVGLALFRACRYPDGDRSRLAYRFVYSQARCASLDGRSPMKRLISLAITVAGLGVFAAADVPTTAANQALVPSVLTCAGKTTVRPSSYVLACADANTYFTSVHWTTWTARSATGTATLVQNNCTPTCAAGKFLKYPAKLTLSAPQSTKLGVLFSIINYSYTVSAATTLPLTTLSSVAGPRLGSKCSTDPALAAEYVIPPPPFKVRAISVQRMAIPPSEPKGNGPNFKRLYKVSFYVTNGNAVLPEGHRYTQFAYVARATTRALWCYLKGGSGP